MVRLFGLAAASGLSLILSVSAPAVDYTVPGASATLNDAITASNLAGGSNTITILSGQTITSPMAGITANVVISGFQSTIAVDLNGDSRLNFTRDGGDYGVSSLVITGGTNGAVRALAENTLSLGGVQFNANSTANDGGAVYVENAVATIQNSSFTGNAADNDGGAVYVESAAVTIRNSSFTGNAADNNGGAVYYAGVAAAGALELSATSGGATTFTGNTLGAGATPNSIYFANPSDGHNAVTVDIDVDAAGSFDMLDPMQGEAATSAASLAVTLNKTGAGVWTLAGLNRFPGPADWNINEGALRLAPDANGAPVQIELGDAASSPGVFKLAAGATLSLSALASGSHQISASTVIFEEDSVIRVDIDGLSAAAAAALKIEAGSINLPQAGAFTINAVNVGSFNGDYTLIEYTGNADLTGKVNGLFDGVAGYEAANARYAERAYYLDTAGQVRIRVSGADAARTATWDNGSGDSLWSLTSENWVLDGSGYKVYKAGDSPVFTGSSDGAIAVAGPMLVDVMTVQGGNYAFSPHNGDGGISGNTLNITGGLAALDLPVDFSGNGAGAINVSAGAGLLLAPGAASIKTRSFNLDGALYVTPVAGRAQLIQAADIALSAGSQVGVSGFTYGDKLGDGYHTVLSLDGGNIINNSVIPVNSGSIQVGVYDYAYNDLYWDGDDLIMLIGSGTPNRERSGAAAVTGPLAITWQNAPGSWLLPRFKYAFSAAGIAGGPNAGQSLAASLTPGQLASFAQHSGQRQRRNPEPGAFCPARPAAPIWRANLAGGGDLFTGSDVVWIKPAYSYTDNHGRSGYSIKTPAWSGGYERWFGDRFFLGLALAGALPEYRSDRADIDAKNISAALYGGIRLPQALELGVFAAYGHTSYDQTRRVADETYDSDYSGRNLGFGLNLGRDFALDENGRYTLRPFAAYEYMHVKTNGYNEGIGDYALKIDKHDENLHLVQAGLDATATGLDGRAHVTGRAYYAGLYGDNRTKAGAVFTADYAHPFTSAGDALDRHSLGLGLDLGFALTDNVEIGAGYNFLLGADNRAHQGNLRVVFRF